MAQQRTVFAMALGLVACVVASCGTDAEGVDDCRDIEQARCAAAAHCAVIDDVEGCQRFYRDQCLHGLAVASPGGPAVKACVAAIDDAGVCAAADPSDTSACAAPLDATSACDAILHPETLSACSFLAPTASSSGGSSSDGSSSEGGTPATGGQSPATASGGSSGATD